MARGRACQRWCSLSVPSSRLERNASAGLLRGGRHKHYVAATLNSCVALRPRTAFSEKRDAPVALFRVRTIETTPATVRRGSLAPTNELL